MGVARRTLVPGGGSASGERGRVPRRQRCGGSARGRSGRPAPGHRCPARDRRRRADPAGDRTGDRALARPIGACSRALSTWPWRRTTSDARRALGLASSRSRPAKIGSCAAARSRSRRSPTTRRRCGTLSALVEATSRRRVPAAAARPDRDVGEPTSGRAGRLDLAGRARGARGERQGARARPGALRTQVGHRPPRSEGAASRPEARRRCSSLVDALESEGKPGRRARGAGRFEPCSRTSPSTGRSARPSTSTWAISTAR